MGCRFEPGAPGPVKQCEKALRAVDDAPEDGEGDWGPEFADEGIGEVVRWFVGPRDLAYGGCLGEEIG